MTKKKKRISKDGKPRRLSIGHGKWRDCDAATCREVWQAWKREHERANKLSKELLVEEKDAKEKQMLQEQAAAKGRHKEKGKAKASDDKAIAYRELYVVDDTNKVEQSSTAPHFWHVNLEWEEFLTKEPIFIEERRFIHEVFLRQMVGKKDEEEQLADDEHVEKELKEELPGHVGLRSVGRKYERRVDEHSSAHGLTSTFVEEEKEFKEQSQIDYSGGPQHAAEQELASTFVEEELKERPQTEYSGGPKHAVGAVEEALTLLQNKKGKATTKELCAVMCSIAVEIFRSIKETNTRLDGIDSRLDIIDSRLDGLDLRFDKIDDWCA